MIERQILNTSSNKQIDSHNMASLHKLYVKEKIELYQKLGSGGFGSVYKSMDNDNECAVKCIDISERGFTCLLEASIMSTINHPFINRSSKILYDREKMYIYQDLAKTDLCTWVRKKKNIPEVSKVKEWLFCILQGLACLHQQGIVHGDIKASNILLYPDGHIRLSDFSLSLRDENFSGKRHKNACTCTHKPPEILLKKMWDATVDIWALGCTLFELMYGELLLPNQGVGDDAPDDVIKDKFLNCILSFAEKGPIKQDIDVKFRNVNFYPFKIPKKFDNPEYKELNDITLSMMKLIPAERPTVFDLLKSDMFKDYTLTEYNLNIHDNQKLPQREDSMVRRMCDQFSPHDDVMELSYSLYCRCPKLEKVRTKDKVLACIWIAHKLIFRSCYKEDIDLDIILPLEKKICNILEFKLYHL